MALNWQQTTRLMRLQATAQEIAAAAKDARQMTRLSAAGRQLDALIAEVKQLLDEADPELAREFAAVAGERGSATAVPAQALAIFGWIKGATQAETFEAKLRADAEAHAQERVRNERRTGFS